MYGAKVEVQGLIANGTRYRDAFLKLPCSGERPST